MKKMYMVPIWLMILTLSIGSTANEKRIVSRETKEFLKCVSIAYELKEKGTPADAIEKLVNWLRKDKFAHRTAKIMLDIDDKLALKKANNEQIIQKLILKYQIACQKDAPDTIELLKKIAEMDPQLFEWENLWGIKINEEKKQEMIRWITKIRKKVEGNPYLEGALIQLGKRKEMDGLCKKNRELTIREIDARYELGLINISKQKEEKAIAQLRKTANEAKEIGDKWGEMRCQIFLIRMLTILGRKNEAKKIVKEIEKDEIIEKSTLLFRNFRYSLGLIDIYEGENKLAEHELIKNVLRKGELTEKDKLDITALELLGFVYEEEGKFDDAMRNYDTAISYHEWCKDQQCLAECILNRGALRQKMNMPEAARNDYQKLFAIQDPEIEDEKLIANGNIGGLYSERHLWEKAIPVFKKVIPIYKKKKMIDLAALFLTNLAECYIGIHDIEKADKILKESMEINNDLKNQRSILHTRIIKAKLLLEKKETEQAINEIAQIQNFCRLKCYDLYIWECGILKGKALAKQGKFKEGLETLQNSFVEFEKLGKSINGPESQIQFNAKGKELMESFIETIAEMIRKGEVKKPLLNLTIEMIDRYRARVLEQQIGIKQLKNDMKVEFTLAEQMRNFLKERKATALIFFEGFQNCYCLVFSPTDEALYQYPNMGEIIGKMQELKKKIELGTCEKIENEINSYSDELIPKPIRLILEKSDEIYCLDDGLTYSLPIEMIVLSNSQGQAQPIGLQKCIYHLPSWRHFFNMEREYGHESPLKKEFLGVFGEGIPAMGYPEVPWASREIQIGKERIEWDSAIVVKGKELALIEKKWAPKKWEIIHLAAHIQVNEECPWESKIIFGQDCSKICDFKFKNMDAGSWKANLVILSGCSSGKGAYFPGEGNLSIARAFLASGSRSILTTSWPVADRASYQFMNYFYSGLMLYDGKAGPALRYARKCMSENPAYADPIHWVGYALYGEPRPITARTYQQRRTDVLFFICLGCMMVLLLARILRYSLKR